VATHETRTDEGITRLRHLDEPGGKLAGPNYSVARRQIPS
jgi:hypothetical protein